jgi:hypothetical protein
VALTFAGAVRLPPDPITVTGPGHTRWVVGPATVLGVLVTAPLQPVGPAGQYTLRYTVISNSDQRPGSGSIEFTLTRPADRS